MSLSLPDVTLVALDTRAPGLAVEALARSMAQANFARAILFTDEAHPKLSLPGLDVVHVPVLRSGADYSRFVVQCLAEHIRSSHVLVTQWDGFILDTEAWTPAFLACDYVGAVWPEQPEGLNVGNGGFSLRSRRFLEASAALDLPHWHPEDEVLCRVQRPQLERRFGVRFASPALARRFAFENETPRTPTFGFHGPRNLARVLDEPTLQRWLTLLPDDFFRSRDARRLARALLGRGMPSTARRLLDRRLAAGRTDPNTRLLSAAATVLQRLATPLRRPP